MLVNTKNSKTSIFTFRIIIIYFVIPEWEQPKYFENGQGFHDPAS